ncbi:MAG: alpha/beta hydrolase [Alphaproteobacteria bacterium]
MLHGAGASASNVMPIVADNAEAHGVVVLAPDSRGRSWDVIHADYGEDVAFLDRALGEVFRTCMIDPARIAIAGFSDGASYALSLGLINGGLFGDIIAFSPGFALPARTGDAPAIFICHGREDPVLPIERCGRRIAVRLRALGYDIDYREFVGGHVVPMDMVEAAFRRFLA